MNMTIDRPRVRAWHVTGARARARARVAPWHVTRVSMDLIASV